MSDELTRSERAELEDLRQSVALLEEVLKLECDGWVPIATVSTWNGMLALVAPYFAGSLNEHWHNVFLPRLNEIRAGLRPRLRPLFEEVKLWQRTASVLTPEGYDDCETALLFQVPQNGYYRVEARFLDGEHALMRELRIRFWDDEDDEDDDDVERPPS